MDRGVAINLQVAVERRRSRRKYRPEPIAAEAVSELQRLAASYTQEVKEAKARIELVLDNGAAFAGLTKSYGMFSGVQNYFALVSQKGDWAAEEKLGYYGELLVLHAELLGLGTCWVGGSFSRSSCPVPLGPNEWVGCTITVGYTANTDSRKERLIRGFVHRKSKSLPELIGPDSEPDPPAWFIAGMEAVQKAPSASNRQGVLFSYHADGTTGHVTARAVDPTASFASYDLGIAKCHFQIGANSAAASGDGGDGTDGAVAGKGAWNWEEGHSEFIYR